MSSVLDINILPILKILKPFIKDGQMDQKKLYKQLPIPPLLSEYPRSLTIRKKNSEQQKQVSLDISLSAMILLCKYMCS